MIEKDETAAGFLSAPGFREWALHPNPENSLFWENYGKAHPEEAEEIAWARQVVAGMQQPEHLLAEEKVDSLWAAIEAGMENPPHPGGVSASARRLKWPAWTLALLTLGLSALLWNRRRPACCRQP